MRAVQKWSVPIAFLPHQFWVPEDADSWLMLFGWNLNRWENIHIVWLAHFVLTMDDMLKRIACHRQSPSHGPNM
jgi:hypothetical protein